MENELEELSRCTPLPDIGLVKSAEGMDAEPNRITPDTDDQCVMPQDVALDGRRLP